jgi:putative ABC transport system permease protein
MSGHGHDRAGRGGARRYLRLPWHSRDRVRADVDEELAFHLEMRERELVSRGLSAEEARREALRQFGDLDDARRFCAAEDARRLRRDGRRDWWAELATDARFALRQMRRAPSFALLAILTLGLGVGASTVMYSTVHQLLVRPLPVPNGNRIVSLVTATPDGRVRVSPSPRMVEAWRTRSRLLEAVAEVAAQDVSVDRGGTRADALSASVSAEAMTLLSARAERGRWFSPEELRRGGPPVVVLGWGTWQREHGGDPAVLGSTVRIDSTLYTIVGVATRGFAVPTIGTPVHADYYLPLAPDPDALGTTAIGLLRDGVDVERASEELSTIMGTLPADALPMPTMRAQAMRPRDMVRRSLRTLLLVLLGACAVVLLIGCANVANLLLARATARQRELAIRGALGAGRARLIRQLLVESVLLACLAGLLGVALAWRGLALVIAMRPDSLTELATVRLQPGIVAASLAVAAATGILFGLVPALLATGTSLGDALRDAMHTHSGQRRLHRIRGGLIVAEVALSVTLLVGAGLLLRSLVEMQRVEPGFRSDGLVSFMLRRPASERPRPDDLESMHVVASPAIVERLRALPGVEGVAISGDMPIQSGIMIGELQVEGRDLAPGERARTLPMAAVGEGYFAVLGQRLLEGRPIDARTAEQEVVVSRSFARAYWPDGSALGQGFRMSERGSWSRVIGVVEDLRVPDRLQASDGFHRVYVPRTRSYGGDHVTLRLAPGTTVGAAAITKAIAEVAPALEVRDVTTMTAEIERLLARPRFNAILLGTFALLALLLAAGGLYGVLAYAVSQRAREMGIRLALGARPGQVRAMMLAYGGRLTLVGVVGGLALAAGLTRLLASLLYGVQPIDGATFAAVAAIVAGIALAAMWVPARRATSVDPVRVLHEG